MDKKDLLIYERQLEAAGCRFIIGIDEAGRGPLAGPVVAAAVVLRSRAFLSRIDDSKKLTPRQRDKAFLEITEKAYYGIGIINEQIIDSVNILQASRLAMEEAVSALLLRVPDARRDSRNAHALVDGLMDLRLGLPYTKIIQGDAKSMSIACASIIAKVSRDRIMGIYDAVFPQYGFAKHKGYPTQEHKLAITKFGPSWIHRKSFSGV